MSRRRPEVVAFDVDETNPGVYEPPHVQAAGIGGAVEALPALPA